jgi:hypothetical protein
VKDTVSAYKQNPYGKKSLELGDSAYNPFAKPVRRSPLFSKPYHIVEPIVLKVDDLGDETLNKVDKRFPVLMKPTDEVVASGKEIAYFPVAKTIQTRDHLFDVYTSELKKVGGEGLITYTKAFISAYLVVTTETLNWIAETLRAGTEKAKETGQHLRAH